MRSFDGAPKPRLSPETLPARQPWCRSPPARGAFRVTGVVHGGRWRKADTSSAPGAWPTFLGHLSFLPLSPSPPRLLPEPPVPRHPSPPPFASNAPRARRRRCRRPRPRPLSQILSGFFSSALSRRDYFLPLGSDLDATPPSPPPRLLQRSKRRAQQMLESHGAHARRRRFASTPQTPPPGFPPHPTPPPFRLP